MDNDHEEVLWEKRNHIRIMTLNRPGVMNAISPGMARLKQKYLREFARDREAWVLIITGKGRAFSSGLDLSTARKALTKASRTNDGSDDLSNICKPVIAAINGYALGGGCELALACDIRIAAEDARIGLPEAKRALIPNAGCQLLPHHVSLGDALFLLSTGDSIDADEAYRIGLVQKVVPSQLILEETIKIAERLCENGPIALQNIKEAVYRGIEMPRHEGMLFNRLLSVRNRQAAPKDVNEGIKAFLEKRKPSYKGK